MSHFLLETNWLNVKSVDPFIFITIFVDSVHFHCFVLVLQPCKVLCFYCKFFLRLMLYFLNIAEVFYKYYNFYFLFEKKNCCV